MEALIGKIMNVEFNGSFVTRGMVVSVKGEWVGVRELNGRTDEWPIGEFYQLVEC